MVPQKWRLTFFLGGCALFLILTHLYLSTMMIDLGDKNTTMKIELDKSQTQNRMLGATWEERVDMNVLEKKAKEMGFEFPKTVYYLLLPTSEAGTP